LSMVGIRHCIHLRIRTSYSYLNCKHCTRSDSRKENTTEMVLRMAPSGMARRPWVFIAVAVMMATFGAHGFRPPIASSAIGLRHRAAHRGVPLRSSSEDPPTEEEAPSSERRRKIARQSSGVVASLLLPSPPARASDDAAARRPYTRAPSPDDKFKFGYTVTPPPSFVPGNKPLKTHLDEINFSLPEARGYALGITVDPVRISKIREFGTPEEVAARVVTAEVNRDGVFRVTLAKDPREDPSAGCYDIEYISDGKRGTKRFVTRIYVRDGFLYVLTLQSKEGEYDAERESDALECVKSFRPL